MTDTEPFGLSKLGQISMRARDVERATAFYRDVLGVPHLFSVPGMAFFDCGGVRLMISVPEQEQFDHPGSILYFDVPDIQAAFESLKARGVQFVDEPHVAAKMDKYELWLTLFHDSEGNSLCLMHEIFG